MSAIAAERPARRFSLIKPLTWLVVVVIVAITVVPLIFVIEGGFRSTAQINAAPVGLPHPWVWSNYTSVLFSSAFWRFLANSALIAVVATGGAVGFGSMAAFALSRIEFKGREAIFTLFTVGLLFPIGVASLPLYLLLERIHLLDNPFGVAVPEAAFSLSITIVILRPFMRAIPAEIEDAAVVDGATRLKFFARILLPLSRPALVTVAILGAAGWAIWRASRQPLWIEAFRRLRYNRLAMAALAVIAVYVLSGVLDSIAWKDDRNADSKTIVDRLFAAAELRLGGDKQQKVHIVRTDGRPR